VFHPSNLDKRISSPLPLLRSRGKDVSLPIQTFSGIDYPFGAGTKVFPLPMK